jgi:hypothetical protein
LYGHAVKIVDVMMINRMKIDKKFAPIARTGK